MSKEVMNPGVGFTLPPEDTYNYKIPDKSGVNDEPEVSGDYYILFKDKLSELKRAITDPEILIEYHMHNLVYANSLPKYFLLLAIISILPGIKNVDHPE